jgi:hypothetical protein
MTNKDLLDKIYREQQDQAKKQLQLAAEFSNYMNKTDLRFKEILGHLESNSKTNTKGVIEQQAINTSDIANFKTDKKIIYSIGVFVTVGINFFFKYIWK